MRLDPGDPNPIKCEEVKMWNQKKRRNNSNRLIFGGACFKKCGNREIRCDECIRYSEFIDED